MPSSIDGLTALTAALAVPLTAVLTYLFTRSKQTADKHGVIAQGANLAVDTMLTAMEQLKAQVTALEMQNAELRTEIKRLTLLVEGHSEECPSWASNT